jgi:flavin reductase (DIM6/NTAB) family NADH-FMN oxidoreductase RutF
MRFDPGEQSLAENYLFMLSAIVPRPIAFISTVGENGVFNLSPFSFFNGVCAEPPILSVSFSRRDGKKKDTLQNIESSGQFVVSVVTEPLAKAMNESSAPFPADISEFEKVGLTPLPAEKVRAPLLKESPINMECVLYRLIEVGTPPRGSTLVLGEIVRYHIREEVMVKNKIDFKKLSAVGRMGGEFYTKTTDVFKLNRPR